MGQCQPKERIGQSPRNAAEQQSLERDAAETLLITAEDVRFEVGCDKSPPRKVSAEADELPRAGGRRSR